MQTHHQPKFHAKSTASEVIQGHDLSGYHVVLTGASDGIGVETARQLAKAGASLVIGARNLEKANKVVDELIRETGNSNIQLEKLELTSLDSVNQFVARCLALKPRIHLVINNAGVSYEQTDSEKQLTEDGFELVFGLNYLAHYVIVRGLLPVLLQTAKDTPVNGIDRRPVRVVNLSSRNHAFSDIDLDDINFDKNFNAKEAYCRSKTAVCLLSTALANLHGSDGILSYSLHPGVIYTNIFSSVDDLIRWGVADKDGNLSPHVKTIEQGASTTLWAALSNDPELLSHNGAYLENCQVSDSPPTPETMSGHSKHIYNVEKALKLWEMSARLVEKRPFKKL